MPGAMETLGRGRRRHLQYAYQGSHVMDPAVVETLGRGKRKHDEVLHEGFLFISLEIPQPPSNC